MKRIFGTAILFVGMTALLAACAPAATPTQDQSITLAAQTIQALMTQVVKQSTPFIPPSQTPTITVPATQTPSPTITETPTALGTNQTPSKMPAITRTLSSNCMSSFFVGIVGAIWDADRKAWVLEELSNVPFTATFDVRNIGTCTWDPAFQLVYYSGEHMSGPNAVLIGSSVDPNDPKFNHVNVDVGPLMIGGKGYHTGYWAMKSSDGRIFGPSFLLTVLIK